MVQFRNVNSCQSLKCIFYKDHFLACNELGNWHQIRIKFLTISQKQKQKQNSPPPQKKNNTEKQEHQPLGVKNCTIKLECKLYYIQTGIHIMEIVFRA